MKSGDVHKIACACGCGAKFAPKRKWHIYASPACRFRAWNKRQSLSDLEKRVERLEKRLGIS